ncbi:MAG: phosphopantetheine-binding protein [Gaiellaceae bacterium]
MSNAIRHELASLFPEALGIAAPADDVDLIEEGVIDSLALVGLLFAIERHFEIEIPPDLLEVDRFRTIERLAELVAECGGLRAQEAS